MEFRKKTLFCLVVSLCALAQTIGAEAQTRRLVYFPRVTIPSGTRIVGFEISIEAVTSVSLPNIPIDWGITLKPEDYRYFFSGLCGHGASALNAPQDLDGAIEISAEQPADVKISGVLKITRDFESTSDVKISPEQIQLKNKL